METLSGILSPASVSLSGTLAKAKGEPYEGEYEVTPSAEQQTLLTGGKLLENDIVVNPVGLPFADVSGVTAIQLAVRSGYKFVNKNGQLLNGTYNPPASSWTQGRFTGGDTYQLTVSSESQNTIRIPVSGLNKTNIASKVLFVRVQSLLSVSSNHFVASDTIFLLPSSPANSIQPNTIMTVRYIGTTKTMNSYNSAATAYGIFASLYEPSASSSSSYLTISIKNSGSSILVSGNYGIQIWSLSLPTGMQTLPNLG